MNFYDVKDGPFDKKQKITNHTLKANKVTQHLSFSLNPKEMAVIATIFGPDDKNPDSPNYKPFNLKYIKITKPDSSVIYAEGDSARHLFHQKK